LYCIVYILPGHILLSNVVGSREFVTIFATLNCT